MRAGRGQSGWPVIHPGTVTCHPESGPIGVAGRADESEPSLIQRPADRLDGIEEFKRGMESVKDVATYLKVL